MFGKRGGKDDNEGANTYIGSDIKCDGTLVFTGTVHFDGEIVGEIESEGVLVLGEGSSVRGHVKVGTLYSSGSIDGDVVVKNKAVLRKDSIIRGELRTSILSIEEGASVDGGIKSARFVDTEISNLVEFEDDAKVKKIA